MLENDFVFELSLCLVIQMIIDSLFLKNTQVEKLIHCGNLNISVTWWNIIIAYYELLLLLWLSDKVCKLVSIFFLSFILKGNYILNNAKNPK